MVSSRISAKFSTSGDIMETFGELLDEDCWLEYFSEEMRAIPADSPLALTFFDLLMQADALIERLTDVLAGEIRPYVAEQCRIWYEYDKEN